MTTPMETLWGYSLTIRYRGGDEVTVPLIEEGGVVTVDLAKLRDRLRDADQDAYIRQVVREEVARVLK